MAYRTRKSDQCSLFKNNDGPHYEIIKNFGSKEDFRCPDCGKKYACRDTVRRHIRYECAGQRYFSCNICKTSFTQNGNLKRHLKNVHNIFF